MRPVRTRQAPKKFDNYVLPKPKGSKRLSHSGSFESHPSDEGVSHQGSEQHILTQIGNCSPNDNAVSVRSSDITEYPYNLVSPSAKIPSSRTDSSLSNSSVTTAQQSSVASPESPSHVPEPVALNQPETVRLTSSERTPLVDNPTFERPSNDSPSEHDNVESISFQEAPHPSPCEDRMEPQPSDDDDVVVVVGQSPDFRPAQLLTFTAPSQVKAEELSIREQLDLLKASIIRSATKRSASGNDVTNTSSLSDTHSGAGILIFLR